MPGPFGPIILPPGFAITGATFTEAWRALEAEKKKALRRCFFLKITDHLNEEGNKTDDDDLAVRVEDDVTNEILSAEEREFKKSFQKSWDKKGR